MSEQNGPAHPDEVLAAAERYAKAGLKIYPVYIPGLKPDGKKDVRPAVRSWAAEATDDLEQVRAWWGGRHRGAGIAVDCGASGIAVADGDMHDGGVQRLRDFLAGEMGHPSNTPSGGVHVWYSDPEGRVGSDSNILGTKEDPSGVDARGAGGTIFMPPTFVPGYGQYRWTAGEPDWSNLPEAPPRLAEVCPPGGRRKRERQAAPSPQDAASHVVPAQGRSRLFGGGDLVVHRDRPMDIEAAKARLMPLWEAVRDTKVPNGLWQAVADFARAAAHYQCFWNAEAVRRMVLAAYAEGGHGYVALDDGDLRAIESAYALQAEARAAGDLDEGWEALPLTSELEPASVSDDAVDALLAEMLKPSELRERPPQPYLVKGLLNLASEAWLIGAPGSRKSFVALDLAAHVAEGREWLGRKVRPGAVIIIAAEGAGGLGSRIKAWEAEHGRLMSDQVHILPRPVQAASPTAWGALVKACERIGPALVIGDTQARLTVGLKENDATDMGIYIAAVGAVKTATGACVLSIHHTGRAGGDARGSSALDGAQDTELKVTSSGEPLRGELHIEKQKDLTEGPSIPLAFGLHVVGVDEDGDPVTSLALRSADAWDAASGVAVDYEPGQEVRIPEPVAGDWTWRVFEHNKQAVQRYILAALAEVTTAEAGITEASAQRLVRDRWFGGLPLASKRKGHLDKATWDKAWAAVRSAVDPRSGEPVVGQMGDRWNVNPFVTRE